jgi:hypothetical protein
MIPYSASPVGGGRFSYAVIPDTTPVVYPVAQMASRGGRTGTTNLAIEFEASMREQAYEHFRQYGDQGRPIDRVGVTSAVPDSLETFWVLNCATSGCNSYTAVTARLKHESPTAWIYADVNQPTDSYTQADYTRFGNQFNAQIFPTDTTAFGPPSDIDGNGHIIILFTPVVNGLTPPGTAGSSGFISGFFNPNDLFSGPSTSNGGEIFYSIVPDSLAEYGNEFRKVPVPNVKIGVNPIIPPTMAHEFEHMISFGYRFVTLGNFSLTQQVWLEEGMAHIAEDLNNFAASNQRRVDSYLLDPGNVSLLGDDTLEQRGGIFLFLRLLGDRLGDDVYRSILRSSCVGRPCVESVTGDNFFASVADFLAALYVSGRGITSDPRYNFQSSVDLGPLAFALDLRDVTDDVFDGSHRWPPGITSTGGDFYIMTGVRAPATSFRMLSSASVRIIVVRIL